MAEFKGLRAWGTDVTRRTRTTKEFLNAIFLDKGFTLTGVWHWRPSLVVIGYDQNPDIAVSIECSFMISALV